MRTTDSQLYPYPVLSPYSDYYAKSCQFEVGIDPEREGHDIMLDFTPALRCESLQSCIDEGTASYTYHIECSRTGYRTAVQTRSPSKTVRLPHEKVNGSVEISPFIVATQPLIQYTSPDFHEDYDGLAFDLEPGCILAVAPTVLLDVQKNFDYLSPVESIFGIVRDDDPNCRSLAVDTSSDKIYISVPKSIYDACRTMRSNHDALGLMNSLVVLPALIHVLEGLELTDESEDAAPVWYNVLARILQKDFGRDIRSSRLEHEEILGLSQSLLENPLVNAFTYIISGFGDDEEEEE